MLRHVLEAAEVVGDRSQLGAAPGAARERRVGRLAQLHATDGVVDEEAAQVGVGREVGLHRLRLRLVERRLRAGRS